MDPPRRSLRVCSPAEGPPRGSLRARRRNAGSLRATITTGTVPPPRVAGGFAAEAACRSPPDRPFTSICRIRCDGAFLQSKRIRRWCRVAARGE